ncbi:hypothetical protein H8356DRAFT_1615988 [Neocallimastix lanati (nom. inval.)]|nr:hypothetical protein H8356DRAFT_1615988 [Neocallimastix sp. JGI-2020a]
MISGIISRKIIILILIYSIFISFTFIILIKIKKVDKSINEIDKANIIIDNISNSNDIKKILYDDDINNKENLDINNEENFDINNEENFDINNEENFDINNEENFDINNEENFDINNANDIILDNEKENVNYIENDNNVNVENVEKHLNNSNNNNNNSNDSNTNINTNTENITSLKENKDDIDYIHDYKGEEIGPEWDWVRNISIVYTWVDGSDVDFSDVKAKYNGGFRSVNSRDRSVDELRYSLRSLEKYLPWHNGTIYILTNNQIPKWLDTTNPRIKVVYHIDIFPEHIYPTYDSNTIEAFLDKIPGITERFIYLNDDFFLNNYIHPCFFFTRKTFYPKIYRRFSVKLKKEEVQKIIDKNDVYKLFTATKYYTEKLIRKYFDKNFVYRDLFHTPYVYYRDLLAPFRELFHEEFKENFSNRFRNGHKFYSQYLFQVYMEYATKHPEFPLKLGGKGKAEEFVGKPLSTNSTIQKYGVKIVSGKEGDLFIKYGEITDNSDRNNQYFNLMKTRPNLLVYNFNDNYSKDKALYEFSGFMLDRYPEPSSFEKKEYKELEKTYVERIIETNSFINNATYELKKTYSSKSIKKFKSMLRVHLVNIVKEYIEKKRILSGDIKEISTREQEEIDFLNSYHGEELSEEWSWAKNTSLVYIIENNNKENLENKNFINELKYSLRSIEKYLPWFEGKIYLISQDENNEDLSWIDETNEHIEIINYRDIIPEDIFPTQNHHVIEMYFDKIPNITEKFIYLKSNHYFRRFTHPRFFFSKEFYPKYNFKDAIPIEKEIILDSTINSFVYTCIAIVDSFGRDYVKSYRHHTNAPYVLYRDLFNPARELFKDFVAETIKHKDYKKIDILPIYMVQNYNIYGTAQPYYPYYIPGYGKVREAPTPILNPKRTVDYYGFDIASPAISESTICSIEYESNISSSNQILDDLKNSHCNFFSLTLSNSNTLIDEDKNNFIHYMDELYKEKSSFEI